jgi:hypothetical protein
MFTETAPKPLPVGFSLGFCVLVWSFDGRSHVLTMFLVEFLLAPCSFGQASAPQRERGVSTVLGAARASRACPRGNTP